MTDYALWTLGWLDGLVEKSSFPFHRSDYLCRESVNAAITRFFGSQMSHVRAFFLSRISRLRAFWGGIFGRNLSEILRNTQNFGRNSEEKIGHWSLWSGHTLGTLNHDLGPLFCCFISLFGAGGSLDPPGAPWCPLAPPCTPWCPHDPWYVILGHSQSFWVIMGHIWPIWSE